MLKGEKVFLRPLQAADMDKTLQWRNDMLIKVSTMSHPFPITLEQESAWYDDILTRKDNSNIHFAICDTVSKEMIGYIHLTKFDWINRCCYWGAAIGSLQKQCKGLGREAVLMVISYAFDHLNMHKVYAHVLADHPALKTWMDTGASIEGTLKKHYWDSGVYKDVQVLAWYPSEMAKLN